MTNRQKAKLPTVTFFRRRFTLFHLHAFEKRSCCWRDSVCPLDPMHLFSSQIFSNVLLQRSRVTNYEIEMFVVCFFCLFHSMWARRSWTKSALMKRMECAPEQETKQRSRTYISASVKSRLIGLNTQNIESFFCGLLKLFCGGGTLMVANELAFIHDTSTKRRNRTFVVFKIYFIMLEMMFIYVIRYIRARWRCTVWKRNEHTKCASPFEYEKWYWRHTHTPSVEMKIGKISKSGQKTINCLVISPKALCCTAVLCVRTKQNETHSTHT